MKLETLNISDVDLRDVDSQLLASSVARVKNVNISGTYLTTDQVNTLCRTIIDTGILDIMDIVAIKKLETLNMSYNVDLSDVDSQLLAKAAVRLKKVDISDTCLTTDQANTLCRTIIEEEESVKKLEALNMILGNLSGVDSQLLANAVVRVKSVDISGTHLTTDQVNTLCQNIVVEEESVKKLESLNMIKEDFRDVDTQLLANAVVRVKNVDISNTHLTTDQVNTICRTIIEEEESVKKLGSLNMMNGDSQLLASAVVRLKHVDISYTSSFFEENGFGVKIWLTPSM